MRAVFLGTPDFAACSLRRMLSGGIEVAGVFCQPDRPQGRGHKRIPPAVKTAALEAGLPLWQPEKLRDGSALAVLSSLKPDVLVVVAYGRILPDDMLALPPLGCINVHGSLLPKYRGSAPVQRSVLAGETRTGVTTMYLSSGMDEGDMIYRKEVDIQEGETSGELMDRLAPVGAELLLKTLQAVEAGTAPRIPQDSTQATYAPPLTREEAPVDWTKPAFLVRRHIFGMQPWPCASAVLGGTNFRLLAAEPAGSSAGSLPGTVLSADKRGLEVACGDGQSIRITQLQAPGGKRMSAGAYLLGHPWEG